VGESAVRLLVTMAASNMFSPGCNNLELYAYLSSKLATNAHISVE